MSSDHSSASLAPLSRSIGQEMQGSDADNAAAAKLQHEANLLHQSSLLHQASLGRFGSDLVDIKWLEAHSEELQLLMQESPMQSCSYPFLDTALSQPLPLPISHSQDSLQAKTAQAAEQLQGTASAPAVNHRAGSEEPIRLQLAYPPAARRQTVTTGFSEELQPLETPPHRVVTRAASQPRPRVGSARSASGKMRAGGSSSSLELRHNLVPEVSLAARAGSLPSSQRAATGRCASMSINGSEDSIEEDEEEEEEEQPETKRRGPGRKRRTAPVLVETEEGEIKHVSPSEYRRLRRRITNRLSARRMRKKHAEERAMIHHTTQELQEEKDRLRAGYEQMQRRANELEVINQKLSAEVADWRLKWDGLLRQDANLAQSLMLNLPRNTEQTMDMLAFRSSHAFQEQSLAAPLPLSLPSSPPLPSSFPHGFDGAFSLPELTSSAAQDTAMPMMPSIPFPDSQLLGQGSAARSGSNGGNMRVYSGRPV